MCTDIKGKRGKGEKSLLIPTAKKTKRKEMSVKKIKLSKCKCICCWETNGCVAKCQHFSQATLFSLFVLFFGCGLIFGFVVHKHFVLCPPPRKQLTTSPYPQIGSRQPQKLPHSPLPVTSTLLPQISNMAAE